MTTAVPLAALEHHAYCERQFALIHVEGLWQDNEHTVRGSRAHRRVDGGPDTTAGGVLTIRGLELWSDRHELVGRADAVEVHPSGQVTPVEYKSGRRHGDAASVQLCAQVLCLEEMFDVEIHVGYVWFGARQRRDPVDIDDSLRETTIQRIARVRELIASAQLPPAHADARCAECQLRGHCMPDVVLRPSHVAGYESTELLRCGA